jgi:hypothetical protein
MSRSDRVAGYIAKYATKATESFGAGLDRRLDADDLEGLAQLPAHVAELVRAAWAWAAAPNWTGCGCGPQLGPKGQVRTVTSGS